MADDYVLTNPLDHSLNSSWPSEIRNVKRIAIGDGLRLYYQASAPATRYDGTAFAAQDLGSIWIDSADNKIHILTATTPTWTDFETVIEAMTLTLSAALTLSETPTFSKGVAATNSYITTRNAADDGNVDVVKAGTSDEIIIGAAAGHDVRLSDATVVGDNARHLADKKYVEDKAWNNDGSTVFNTTLTTANTFQDLDLSSYVGTGYALVFLEVTQAGCDVMAKPKGYGGAASAHPYIGCSALNFTAGSEYGYITCATDDAGVIQIAANSNSHTVTIKLVGFIGLNP